MLTRDESVTDPNQGTAAANPDIDKLVQAELLDILTEAEAAGFSSVEVVDAMTRAVGMIEAELASKSINEAAAAAQVT